jgi:hypothetical protein
MYTGGERRRWRRGREVGAATARPPRRSPHTPYAERPLAATLVHASAAAAFTDYELVDLQLSVACRRGIQAGMSGGRLEKVGPRGPPRSIVVYT